MTTSIKIQKNYQIQFPQVFAKKAGLKIGDFLTATKVVGRKLVFEMVPNVNPNLDKGILQGLADLKQGHAYGPFSASQAVKFLGKKLKDRKFSVKK